MPDIFALPEQGRVKLTEELIRIVRLPRRTWTDGEAQRLADEMTEILKTPFGQMRLRPHQAIALLEIGTVGGVFAPLRVGAGKTLISLLAPIVAFADRPLLVVPAKLAEKTQRDAVQLARHWRLPSYLPILTYEWLGRIQAKDALDERGPDFVVFDEAHKLRNPKAAVTRRVRRFFSEHANCRCAVMSGTMTKRSLHDYASMLRWVFGLDLARMPIPRQWRDLEDWADALDERKGQTKRANPDSLELLCDDAERVRWTQDPRDAARSAFRRRLVETEGVVATAETTIDATLTISEIKNVEIPKVVEEAFDKLRQDAEMPDGWQLIDRLEAWAAARQLALGFYYAWEPRPPRPWLDARKTWAKFVWSVLKHSRELDSELQVRRAHPDSEELKAWLEIKDSFEPNTVPVWLDDFALRRAVEWSETERGIIWTEHVVFGERLESNFGLSYYGRKGLDRTGRLIDDHPVGYPLVASIASNAEGRNLQAWNTNLITACPANGKNWEQLLGRTHRDGQLADEVQVDVFNFCAEHLGAFWQSVKDAEYVQSSTGAPQKLLMAGKFFSGPADLLGELNSRWNK